MTKTEMIEQLISLRENAKSNIDTDEIFRKDYEALEIALKLIDEQETEKRLNNKVIDKRNEENLKLAASNFKKSKIINEMTKLIQEVATSTPGTTFYYLRKQGFDDSKCKNCITEKGCGECIKQYFKKKAEDN